MKRFEKAKGHWEADKEKMKKRNNDQHQELMKVKDELFQLKKQHMSYTHKISQLEKYQKKQEIKYQEHEQSKIDLEHEKSSKSAELIEQIKQLNITIKMHKDNI